MKKIILLLTMIILLSSFITADVIVPPIKEASAYQDQPNTIIENGVNTPTLSKPSENRYSYSQLDLSNNISGTLTTGTWNFEIAVIKNLHASWSFHITYCDNDTMPSFTWNNQTSAVTCNATSFWSQTLPAMTVGTRWEVNLTKIINKDADKKFILKTSILPADSATPRKLQPYSIYHGTPSVRPYINFTQSAIVNKPNITNVNCTSPSPDVTGMELGKTCWSNDDTNTIVGNTDLASTCGVSNTNSSYTACTTTGGTSHICTYPSDQGEGSVVSYMNCTSGGLSKTLALNFFIKTTNPDIVFNTPSSQTYTNTLWVIVNVTATDIVNVNNISVYRNGVLITTNTTPVNNTPWIYNLSFPSPANYTVYFKTWDNVSTYNSNTTETRWFNLETNEYYKLTFYSSYNNNEDDDWNFLDSDVDGASYTTDGHTGMAYEFDGINDRIVTNSTQELNITTAATWMVWAKTTNTSAENKAIFSKYDAGANKRSWRFYQYRDDLSTILSDNGTNIEADGTSNACGFTQNDTWTHIAIVYNSTHLLWYKNGTLCETDTTGISSIFFSDNPMTIGSRHLDNEYEGNIDEVGIWKRALNATEILSFYTATQGTTQFENKYIWIDSSHSDCSNSINRIHNTEETPWCNMNGPFAYTENGAKIEGGDKLFFKEGDYNADWNGEALHGKVLQRNLTITPYGTDIVNITNYVSTYASVPNTLWDNISVGGRYFWNTTFSFATSDVKIFFENQTKFISDKYFDGQYVSMNGSDRPFYRGYANDTTNMLTIRSPDASFNPNLVPLYIVDDTSALRIYCNSGPGYIIIDGFNFKYNKVGIHYWNQSRTVAKNNNFYSSGDYGLYYYGLYTAVDHKAFNNYMNGRWNWNWYEDIIKETYEETSSIHAEQQKGNMEIYNNTFEYWGGGVTLRSVNQNDFQNLSVHNNLFNYGSGSQLEIEDYCYNSRWYNNTILNSQMAVSFGPAQAPAGNSCEFDHNVVIMADYILHNETTNYTTYALKLYRVTATGPNVTYWNVNYNTFVGGKSFNGLWAADREDAHWYSNWTNNIFYSTSASSGVHMTGESENGVFFDYNLYFKTVGGDLFYRWNNDSDANGFTTLALARASSNWDGNWDNNSLNEDPLFTNIENNNAIPLSSSPVCGAGTGGTDIGALLCSDDTCVCPTNQNWEINMNDSCNIVSNCNITGYNISFIGVGYTRFNATIVSSNRDKPLFNQTLWKDSNYLGII